MDAEWDELWQEVRDDGIQVAEPDEGDGDQRGHPNTGKCEATEPAARAHRALRNSTALSGTLAFAVLASEIPVDPAFEGDRHLAGAPSEPASDRKRYQHDEERESGLDGLCLVQPEHHVAQYVYRRCRTY